MSMERLEAIKQQIGSLSRQEQSELSQFLEAQMKLDKTVSVAPPAPPAIDDEAEHRRLRNMEWMKAHAGAFGGQYIALAGGRLIGATGTFREAREAARAAGERNAFVTYLPKPDELLETGGWL